MAQLRLVRRSCLAPTSPRLGSVSHWAYQPWNGLWGEGHHPRRGGGRTDKAHSSLHSVLLPKPMNPQQALSEHLLYACTVPDWPRKSEGVLISQKQNLEPQGPGNRRQSGWTKERPWGRTSRAVPWARSQVRLGECHLRAHLHLPNGSLWTSGDRQL